MSNSRKKPNADLRKYYTLFLQLGMIVVLLVFITAMKIEIKAEKEVIDYTEEHEVVKMKEVIQTKQVETPPPPPRPPVPIAVPNDEIIEDEILNISADLDLDQRLELPPPPQQEGDEENFFVAVEQMPKLIGGLAALQQKIEYPEMARRAGIEGRVIIQFIVDEQGNVVNPRVLRGIGGGCDKEALRVVKNAKFKPGRQRGKPVRVQYSLPIIYRLQN